MVVFSSKNVLYIIFYFSIDTFYVKSIIKRSDNGWLHERPSTETEYNTAELD